MRTAHIEPRRRDLLRAGSALALAASGAVGWGPLWSQGLRTEPRRVLEERDTQFGRVSVVEAGRKRYLVFGADVVYQSVIDLDRPYELAAPYTRLMMLGAVYAQPYTRMVQIGVGAGNMTGYAIRTFPSAVVHAVDIDRDVVELGARHFGLTPNPRLHLHIEDGRRWLANSRETFDVIMLDAYDDKSIPPALMDAEFFRIVARRLAPTGVVMQNVYLPVVDTRRLLLAMRQSFTQVDFYKAGDSAVLAAYDGKPRELDLLTSRARQLDQELRPAHPLAGLLANRTGSL